MSLATFKHTKKGAAVGAILQQADSLRRMEQLSRADRPAVEAVGADIAATVGGLDDGERKLVGRWVKELLAPLGLVPDRKGRVAPGHLFARGTIYRFAGTPRPLGGGAARLAAARAILATSPEPIQTSAELIAQRRSERS